MAFTIADVANGLGEDKWGRAKIRARDFTFDSSYPTGGEVISPAQFGFKHLHCVIVGGSDTEAIPYEIKYNYATGKLMVFQAGSAGTISQPTFTVTKGTILASSELGLSADAATATVNNNTIASTLVLTTNSPVSAPTFTGSGASLSEVTNGTDLSTLTVRVIGISWGS